MVEEIKGITKPYDHSKQKLAEAMGLNIEQMDDVWNKEIFNLCYTGIKESELAEILEVKLNRRQLTFYATCFIWEQYQKALAKAEISSGRIIIFKMRGSSPDK